ncbi:MAG TPA: NlpC/P60 family peptidoglycan-binding protein RipD [Mycobacterium sp.]|nr:NlpC/P60 family peptidoglycan-binding protein RipD [Mycobacterium sp.]
MKRLLGVAAGVALSLAPVLAEPGLATADPRVVPAGAGSPIEIVIQRALSQRGVPYVYGGGNFYGPTNGVREDSKTIPGIAAALPGMVAGTGMPGQLGTQASPVTPGYPAAGTVGFDSSGLIQYAFAGAGIKMPRRSGDQCSVGQKVAPAQARPGDLICFGPGGNQSVALFLGNGQMIEGTSPAVEVTPVRTSNMMPYLTRIIGP